MNATKQEKLCKNCAKPISAGEEIKIERELRTYEYSVNQGGKYWKTYQRPIEKASYYLCRSCFKELEKEIAREITKTRKEDIFWILIILLVIVAFVVGLILIYWFKNKK